MPNKSLPPAPREDGFTLVELMVVILLIGVLMAIAIPAFYGARDRSFGSSAKTIRSTAIKTLEVYSVDHGGSYAGANADELSIIEPTPIFTDNPGIVERAYVHDAVVDGYIVDVLGRDGKTYTATKAAGGTPILNPK